MPMTPSHRLSLVRVYWRRVRAQSLGSTIRRVADPAVLRRHLSRLARGEGAGTEQSNAYLPSHSREDEAAFVATLTGADIDAIAALFDEVEQHPVMAEIAGRYQDKRGTPLVGPARFRMWYAIVRLTEPELVVETGVHDGLSTAVVLLALDANDRGRLVSVDLPATDLPVGVDGAGWLAPESLRGRWTFRAGDARVLLPKVLEELDGRVGLFIHDSDHSAEHQTFEFATVLPYMAAGGVLLSDQDYPHETVLPTLAESAGGRRARVQSSVPGPNGVPTYAGGVTLP